MDSASLAWPREWSDSGDEDDVDAKISSSYFDGLQGMV